MRTKLFLTVLAFALCFASCKKNRDEVSTPEETSIDNIKVSDTFDWSTTQDVNFSIGTSDARFQNLIHVIYIYDMDPAKGGKVLAKGSTTLITPFNTKVTFAKATKTIYVMKVAPDGAKIGQEVALSSNNINLSFNETSASQLGNARALNSKNLLAEVKAAVTVVIPACGRSTTSTNINVGLAETVCFNSTTDATLNIQNIAIGGTVRINAPGRKVTIGTFNQNLGLNIVVEPNTTVSFGTAELKTGYGWVNNGTLEFTGKFTLSGLLTNNGTLKLATSEIVALGVLNNFGTLTATAKADIAGTLNNSTSATYTDLALNIGGLINNYCKLYADNLQSNSVINNYSYILAKNTFKSNAGGRVNMIGFLISGSYFETKKIEKGANEVYFIGINATSLVKATEIDASLISEATLLRPIITGNINLWTSASITNNFFLLFPSTLGNTAYIRTDDCMPVANGNSPTQIVKDTDGDGVADNDDDYPNDNTRAYNNYSVNYTNGGSTLAFEDSWPVKGDYDLNDVVITYRHMVVTNANNRVVELKAGYKLIATGADYTNGFGIELPISASKVKLTTAPTGTYLEGGQDNAVLILFDNSRSLQANGNTVVGRSSSPAVDLGITLTVTDGPEIKNFGAVAYNPFIWNGTNGFGRGYETHLYGKTPTNLANQALFDTKDDFSKTNNKFYSTKEKLPWAIEVPIGNFGYPIEGARITQAYNNFANWATSSGASSAEWYLTLAGGANPVYIYPR